MNPRPKHKIPFEGYDFVVEILGWLCIAILWASYYFFHTNNLYLAISILGTSLYIIIWIISLNPHILNYAVKITDENAIRQYTIAVRFLRYFKLIVVFLLYGIGLFVVKLPNRNALWVIPILFVLVILPLGLSIRKSIKQR